MIILFWIGGGGGVHVFIIIYIYVCVCTFNDLEDAKF